MKIGGFTLIELMIVVAVIGILAAIAYPSYGRYVDRPAIADGKSAVLSTAQQLERCFTRFDAYSNAGCVIRQNSEEGFYAISATRAATTYLVTAKAVGVRPKTPTACKTLAINQMGQRGSGEDVTNDADDCW